MRTITMSLEPERLTEIANITGNAALFEAIGYLAQWNLTHPQVHIMGGIYDGTPEISAVYRKEAGGPITYNIGAVWHWDDAEQTKGHFGFHS